MVGIEHRLFLIEIVDVEMLASVGAYIFGYIF